MASQPMGNSRSAKQVLAQRSARGERAITVDPEIGIDVHLVPNRVV